MYVNTTYNHIYYEAMHTQYYHARQTEMFANVHYVPIRQTYCSSYIPHIRYVLLISTSFLVRAYKG